MNLYKKDIQIYKKDNIINKAIEKYNLLTFDKFIIYCNININKLVIDKFFHNIKRDVPIYFDKSVVDYFGYNGTDFKKKEKIINLIKANFSEYKNKLWWELNNKEYENFISSINNPMPLLRGIENIDANSKTNGNNEKNPKFVLPNLENIDANNETNDNNEQNNKIILYPNSKSFQNKTKHLFVSTRMFKEMLMLCNTKKGKQVRKYYIEMLDVYEIYREYQIIFEIRQSKMKDVKIDELKKIIIGNEKKAEEERKKA